MIQACTPETVIEILQTKVGVPTDIPDIDSASWEDLGVDSLGLSETFSSVENLLNIDIPHDKAMQVQNVQELVDLINKLVIEH